jgi:hypothetical protein
MRAQAFRMIDEIHEGNVGLQFSPVKPFPILKFAIR